MTQAFNLSQLANNLNTSGQLDATDGLTGIIPTSNLPTIPASKGGTGQISLTANNVLLGNGTSAVQFVAPSTSGNLLTSNGTTWVSQPISVPAPTTAQVLSATAGGTVNAVGVYAFARFTAGSDSNYNATIAGSDVWPCAIGMSNWVSYTTSGADVTVRGYRSDSAMSGTWRIMGVLASVTGYQSATLVLRIS